MFTFQLVVVCLHMRVEFTFWNAGALWLRFSVKYVNHLVPSIFVWHMAEW